MALFGRRRQKERDSVPSEVRDRIETAIAVVSARVRFLEALTFELVADLPPAKRDRVLRQLQEVVGELQALPAPMHVSPGREEEFFNVLRTAMQVLIEKTAKARPISR